MHNRLQLCTFLAFRTSTLSPQLRAPIGLSRAFANLTIYHWAHNFYSQLLYFRHYLGLQLHLDGPIRANRLADSHESLDSRESFQGSRTEPQLFCQSRFGELEHCESQVRGDSRESSWARCLPSLKDPPCIKFFGHKSGSLMQSL